MRVFLLWCLLLVLLAPVVCAQETGPTPSGDILILADPGDPYYSLAEELARQDEIPIVHTLEQVLAADPRFLLWVVSPRGLSDRLLVDFGRAMRDRRSAISTGIISGSTIAQARELVQRADSVRGERVAAVNAANPSGHIEAAISQFGADGAVTYPLTKETFLQALRQAGYLTYTGHGGQSALRLDSQTVLEAGELPALPPAVIATGSCNTFRPWEENSIALAFTDRGAAAYAGFAYSPNEGYLIGEFDGLPMRHSWPGFPIGHVLQVQNQGTLQGFAQFPYYYLLGDPRIALQSKVAYRVVEDRVSGNMRVYSIADAPPGVLPIHVPEGADYRYVQIPGIGAAWEDDPFYNARLQMVNIGEDKFLLVEQTGGELTLHLYPRPPWYWVPYDLLTDALDTTLLYLTNGGGDLILLVAGALAWLPVAWRQRRRQVPSRTLGAAALTGLAFAALYGLYALTHLANLSITSKSVEFRPLALVDTFLLVSNGAYLFLTSRSGGGKVVAVLVASFGALAPALFALGMLGAMNVLVLGPRLGTALWNYHLGLQPLFSFVLEFLVFGTVFFCLSQRLNREVVRV